MKNTYRLFSLVALLVFGGSLHHVSAQWEGTGSGLSGTTKAIFSLDVVDDNTVWAVPINLQFQDIRDVIRTTDGGETWDALELPETEGNHMPQRIFALSDTEAWVSVLRYPGQAQSRIFHTTDGGATWADQLGPFNNANQGVENIHFFNDTEGIAFGSPNTGNLATNGIRVYRTADAGTTWLQVSTDDLPPPISDERYILFSGNDSYAAQGDTLWFTTTLNRIFRTVNRGANWQAFITPLPGSTTTAGLASIAFKDHLNGMVVSFLPQQGAITADGGATWTAISMPAQPQARNLLYIPNTDGAYLLSDGFEQISPVISYTLNGGVSWGQLDGNPLMNCLAFTSAQSGWGGTNLQSDGQAMYKWTSDWLLNLSTGAAEKSSLSLYPNPAEAVIYVNQGMAQAGPVAWMIRDITGRIVSQGIDDGNEAFKIDVRNLVGGTYLLQTESAGRQAISKFIKY